MTAPGPAMTVHPSRWPIGPGIGGLCFCPRHEGGVLLDRLRHEQVIERVAVMHRYPRKCQEMRRADVQEGESLTWDGVRYLSDVGLPLSDAAVLFRKP